MKIKKITHNHILSWIYALVVAVPLVTILVRCCYVTFNKNAFESYETINNENQQYIVASELASGTRYYFNTAINTFENTSGTQKTISFNIDNVVVEFSTYSWFDETIRRVQLYINSNSNRIILYAFNGANINVGSATLYNDYLINFYFNFVSFNTNITNYSYFENAFFEVSSNYVIPNTLDNAFEYSINELTQNGNTGNLNLVNWFGDLFLDMDNAKTQLYLGFINYYLNYVLMVSCVYLLFSVLMWFLTWARRILSKGLGDY